MSVYSIAFYSILGLNALLFISILLLRSNRPQVSSRLFRWVVHSKTEQAAGKSHKNHLPA